MYRLGDDGAYVAASRLAGYNVARVEAPFQAGEARLRSREIFFTTDLARTTLAPAPPLTAAVAFAIAVRGGKPMAGLDGEVNGECRAEAVPAAEILAVSTPEGRCFLTRPVVRGGGGRPPWAAESWEFTLSPSAAPALVWQRVARSATDERSHSVAVGRRFGTLDEVAAASPLAAQIVRLVRERYPDHADASPPALSGAPPAATSLPSLTPRHRQP